MAETVKRLRETGARLVLLIGAGYVLLSLVRFGYLVVRRTGVGEAAHTVAGSSLSIVMVLVIVCVLLTLVMRPVTAGAARLLRAGAWLVGIAAALELVFLVLGLTAGRLIIGAVLEVLGALLEVGLKVAAAVLLWRVAQGVSQPGIDPAPEPATRAVPAAPERPRVQPAAWGADEAAGAVWTRAGDAASGAAASGWGHPGAASGGWRAEPAVPELTSGPRSAAGPWATAGQLASGAATTDVTVPSQEDPGEHPGVDAAESSSWDAQPAVATEEYQGPGEAAQQGPRRVSWTVAPRDE